MDGHASGAGYSLKIDAEAFGSPSDNEQRTDLPPHVVAAIRGGLTSLRLASTMLTCLSSAANHDSKIDTSSVGVAEVACRLIGAAADQLVQLLRSTTVGVVP